MNKPRLVAVVLLKHGLVVRSQQFKVHQAIGNPVATIRRLSNWNVDELILLDISQDDWVDLRRNDLQVSIGGSSMMELLGHVAEVCYMPLAIGGRIRSLMEIEQRLSVGADKCVINTAAVERPEFVGEAAARFGAQCIVVNIDVLRHQDGRLEVVTRSGKSPTGKNPAEWARQVADLGAGEVFLNSIDRDGMAVGYDLELVRQVSEAVNIPVIACGGVGTYDHFPQAIVEGGAAAAAAANIFHFFELAYPHAKQTCIDAGLAMRPVRLGSHWFPREPEYDVEKERDRVADRQQRAKSGQPLARPAGSKFEIRWCTRCCYSSISATPAEFDADGVCMGCRMAEAKEDIPPDLWETRRAILYELLDRGRSRDGRRHDCIIAVSGGKDSYFQTHVIKNEMGFNPLLVTYNANNYTDVGWRNLLHMKEAFGVDHIIHSPSVDALKKLNRLGFVVLGDMNWHCHVGIGTVPMKYAVQLGVPIVVWGEHGYADLAGQFSMNDYVDFTYRYRAEHWGRGYEWNYFVGLEGLTASDLWSWQYPTDKELWDLGLRGIHLANYVYWEGNAHTKLVIDKYGFEVSEEPFDRTYRTMSNLDDMHENGVHDYLKFIKFGYGRCTDHVCKDIRAGSMARGQAIELVRQYDHVKPRDLYRWLDYVGMSEDEFDRIADTFRDPRVWRKENNVWQKPNIWD